MTVAVCVNCGSIKLGAFTPCQRCGVYPSSEMDLAYSLALTDHYFSPDTLKDIGRSIGSGKPRPTLPPDQEAWFLDAARSHIADHGALFNLPPPENREGLCKMAKFRGWGLRPVSRLQWRCGFGWASVGFFTGAAVTAYFTPGLVKIIPATFAALVLVHMLMQWWKYNRRGWPRLHYRAMLLYAGLAGTEAARAENESREPDVAESCRALALAMIGGLSKAHVADALIESLLAEGNMYLFQLILRHGKRLRAAHQPEGYLAMSQMAMRMKFGPQMMLVRIIENSFGGEEAVRYVIALFTDRAR